jgi:stage V sporulation protein S
LALTISAEERLLRHRRLTACHKPFFRMDELFKVSNQTSVRALAGGIAHKMRKGEPVELQAIGALAVMRSVEAINLADAFLEPDGIDLAWVPQFITLDGSEGECIAIRFLVNQLDASFPQAVPIPRASRTA